LEKQKGIKKRKIQNWSNWGGKQKTWDGTGISFIWEGI